MQTKKLNAHDAGMMAMKNSTIADLTSTIDYIDEIIGEVGENVGPRFIACLAYIAGTAAGKHEARARRLSEREAETT